MPAWDGWEEIWKMGKRPNGTNHYKYLKKKTAGLYQTRRSTQKA